MATTEEEEYFAQVDPRLQVAMSQGGVKGYTGLLLGLAGTQTLTPETQRGIFWQLIGWLSGEAGRAQARPWQYLSMILLLALFAVIAYTWQLLLMIALGVF